MTDRELMHRFLASVDVLCGYAARAADGADIAWHGVDGDICEDIRRDMKALRTRLAQPEQEPCNWVVDESVEGNLTMSWMLALPMPVGTKLYTTPPQREWQGLTDEEIKNTLEAAGLDTWLSDRYAASAIEAKLKEKNT